MTAAGVKGLGEEEVQAVRDQLAAGRKPKVMFTESAGQIAGQIGQVVALTDPAESDEWVVVRFGRDELPFSPADVVIAPKGATPVKKVAPAPPPPKEEPEFVIDKPVEKPKPVATPPQPEAPAPGSASGSASATSSVPAPRKAVAKPKPKPQPGLTVTLAYNEGEWTVAANQGSKALAKPYVVRPAEAMKIVALVDVPGVQEAVEHILAAERAEAEEQAQRLRAELAEIEARIQELNDADPAESPEPA